MSVKVRSTKTPAAPTPSKPQLETCAPARSAPNYEPTRLYWRWLRSSSPTPKAYAARHALEWAPLQRASVGWVRRRALLEAGRERALPQSLVRLRLDGLWWELLQDLGDLLDDGRNADEGIKRLSAAAAVLKAAQNGLASTGAWGEGEKHEAASGEIEGFDVARI